MDSYMQHVEMGQVHFNNGQHVEALSCFEKALSDSPQSPELLNIIGALQWELGRQPEALQAFEDAIGINPNYREAVTNLVQTAASVGEGKRAMKGCEIFLAQNANDNEIRALYKELQEKFSTADCSQKECTSGQLSLRQQIEVVRANSILDNVSEAKKQLAPIIRKDVELLIQDMQRLRETDSLVDFITTELDSCVDSIEESKKEKFISELRQTLMVRPDIFYGVYTKLSRESWEEDQQIQSHQFGVHATKMSEMLVEVRKNGYAIWKDFLTETAKSDITSITNPAIAKAIEVSENPPEGQMNVEDSQHRCSLTHIQLSKQMGRYRCNYIPGKHDAFQPINDLRDDKRITEIANCYYGISTRTKGLLIERLIPAPTSSVWHLDGITDGFKCMVLLSDVSEEDGPFLMKPHSHRSHCDLLLPVVHNVFCGGRHWGCIPDNVVDDLEIDTHICTGKAGDAIFFDTLSVHSGSMPNDGHSRDVAVHYVEVNTRKNSILWQLGGPHYL